MPIRLRQPLLMLKTDGALVSPRKAAARNIKKIKRRRTERIVRGGGVSLLTSRRGLAAWITVTRYPV